MAKGKYKEEIRTKVVKMRANDTEFSEFEKASKQLNIKKTDIIREAVKKYLAEKDIHIWNN